MTKDNRRAGGSAGGGDRFAVFPFSIGCMSQSAVAVADPAHDKKQPQQSDQSSSSSTAAAATTTAQSSSEEGGTKEKAVAAPGIVTAGVQRLVKGIKQSLSQMFAVDDGDGDEEEEEHEMVIGYPTDVQHVGHIGWDGHGGGLNKVGAMAMVNAFSALPSSLTIRPHQLAEVPRDQAAHA